MTVLRKNTGTNYVIKQPAKFQIRDKKSLLHKDRAADFRCNKSTMGMSKIVSICGLNKYPRLSLASAFQAGDNLFPSPGNPLHS